jgi:tetratricopeptide (TPR) repeat protein
MSDNETATPPIRDAFDQDIFSPFHNFIRTNKKLQYKMQSTIHFNDMGISYYKAGKMDLAIYAFTDALSQTRKIIAETSSKPDAPLNSHYSTEGPDVQEKVSDFCDDSSMEIGDDAWMIQTTTSCDTAIFVFGEICEISHDGSDHSLTLAQCGLRCMFNLALSHHRVGVEEQSQPHLDKALRVYGLAYSLLTTEEGGGCPVMLAAIVNNLGHVHLLEGNMDKAQRCYEHLLMALMFVTVGSSIRLSDELHEGFFSNVMNMVLTDQRKLAPAA